MNNVMDDLDRSIIKSMRLDPRIPAKALAHQLNVTEQTISLRIRKLREANLLRVVVQSDVYAMGFEFVCMADIYVSGRAAADVAKKLQDVKGISSVVLSLGTPEIIVVFHATDREDFQRIVATEFSAIRGLDHVETFVSMDIAKYRTDYAQLNDD